MYVINNSPRALLAALIPLGIAHAVMLAMALLGAKAIEAELQDIEPERLVARIVDHAGAEHRHSGRAKRVSRRAAGQGGETCGYENPRATEGVHVRAA